MSKYIEHDGVIVSQVAEGKFAVKIVQQSACASCHAAKLCSAAESKDKIIEAQSTDSTLNIGDSVVVYGRAMLGYKALIFMIVIPLVISLLTLVIAEGHTTNELYTGIAALAILVPYYGILACFRKKLQREFIFYVKPKQA